MVSETGSLQAQIWGLSNTICPSPNNFSACFNLNFIEVLTNVCVSSGTEYVMVSDTPYDYSLQMYNAFVIIFRSNQQSSGCSNYVSVLLRDNHNITRSTRQPTFTAMNERKLDIPLHFHATRLLLTYNNYNKIHNVRHAQWPVCLILNLNRWYLSLISIDGTSLPLRPCLPSSLPLTLWWETD